MPRIAERIDLDGIPAAHRRIEEGGLNGKIILCPAHPIPKRVELRQQEAGGRSSSSGS